MSDQVHEPERTSRNAPPLHPEMFETLNSAGRMRYGAAFKWDEILPMLKMSMADLDSWGFREEWIPFRQMCMDELGLIATERGMDGTGFRFLDRDEMASYVCNKEMRKARDSIRNSVCLSMVPRDGLDAQNQRKLDHWEAKSAFVGAVSQALLRKRKLIGDPKRVVKRIGDCMKD